MPKEKLITGEVIQVSVILKKKEKQFGSQTKSVWEILLGDFIER